MQNFHEYFHRNVSNNKVIQNDHFISKLTPHSKADMNITQQDLIKNNQKILKKQSDYQPAAFSKALKYKYQRSYYIKTRDNGFKEIQLLQQTKSLKYFGLGPYFYIQFMRRICWIFFLFAILQGIRIYINFKSSGLSNYSVSFSTYLITTTLGNYNSNIITSYDAYIVALVPAAIFAFFSLFYLCWKCHFYSEISEEEQNNSNIKPQKFCIQVQGINDKCNLNEDDLHKIFSNFGAIHEISIVRRHKNKLQYFEQLQQMQQKIHQIQLQLRFQQDNNNLQKLNKLRQQKQLLLNQLKITKINPKTVSAYIHFQYQKSKVDCLAFFNDHYLFNICGHSCVRNCCCCCLSDIEQKYKLRDHNLLLIKHDQVPAPEDINWASVEISICSKLFRLLFAFLIIVLFLLLSCTIIGLCTIYVTTHSSNCDSVTIPTSLLAATLSNDPLIKTCYCNANLISSLTDSSIKTYCADQLKSIYIQQSIQYAIILTSALTNFLFELIVDKIVNCTRPNSQSHSLKIKTLIYTIFLILNTVILPILLYSDIFGFKTSSYFSFITLISSGLSNFLSVDNLQFYIDYSQVWYRNVSPIFTNYLIFDLIAVWIMLLIDKYRASYNSLADKQHKIIQKHMNQQIVQFQFSPYKEYSTFLMIVFMTLFLNSGIPVLLPLAWLNLVSRYIANRSLIQNNSKRVDGLGIAFNQLSHTLLPILIAIGCVNGCWMLTANSQISSQNLPFKITVQTVSDWVVVGRQLNLPFYLGIAILIMGEYLFYHFVLRFCACICGCCFQRKITSLPSHSKTFSQHKKTMNILTSYNIKNNDEMRNAVTRMERYIQNKS